MGKVDFYPQADSMPNTRDSDLSVARETSALKTKDLQQRVVADIAVRPLMVGPDRLMHRVIEKLVAQVRQGETIVAPPCGLPAIGLPKVEEATYGRTTMNDNKLEDIAWRLIAEAKVERNPYRRRRLMQEAFELVRWAGALREMDAERDANFAPHALGRERLPKTA
jgi:hypothetical protein